LILFDAYVHGDLDRRGFLDKAAKYAVGGVTAAMLLEHSLDAPEAAQRVREAVAATLAAGHRTADLAGFGGSGASVGCRRMGDLVMQRLEVA